MNDAQKEIQSLHHAVARATLARDAAEAGRRVMDAQIRAEATAVAKAWGAKELTVASPIRDVAKARGEALQLSALLEPPRQRTMDLDITRDFQIFAPPYDDSWNVGSGTPLNHLGDPMVFGGDGFSAAGFALNLTTDAEAWVAVVPQGRFKGNWVNFSLEAAPSQRSAAGTGAVVYADGAEVLARTTRVWDVNGMGPMAGQNFDLPFADTASPAAPGSLGTAPLAPVLISMTPGVAYQVWFYVWAHNSPLAQGVIAISSARIPMVTITAGPPPHIH
jgi:hypothetical protein